VSEVKRQLDVATTLVTEVKRFIIAFQAFFISNN